MPLLGTIGFDATERLAKVVARRVHALKTPGRRAAEARIHSVLSRLKIGIQDGHKPPSGQIGAGSHRDAESVCAALYEHVARFWAEAIYLRRRLRNSSWRRYVRVEGEPAICPSASYNPGTVFATAYTGNPAVAAVALGHLFRPVHVLVDYLHQPALRTWQNELYRYPNIRPVTRQEAPRVVPRVLEGHGALLMIMEHQSSHGRAVELQFLGTKMRCYPTLDRLAKWYNAPVIPITCRRLDEPFKFVVESHGRIEANSNRVGEGEVTRRVMAALEAAIMRHPEQYLWSTGARTNAPIASLESRTPANSPVGVNAMAAKGILFENPRVESPCAAALAR